EAGAFADGGVEAPGEQGAPGEMSVGPEIGVVLRKPGAVTGDPGGPHGSDAIALSVVGAEFLEPGGVAGEEQGQEGKLLAEGLEVHRLDEDAADVLQRGDRPGERAKVVAEGGIHPVGGGERVGQRAPGPRGPGRLLEPDVPGGGPDGVEVPEI